MSKTNKNWFLLVRNDVKKTLDTDLDTEIAASEMYYVHRPSAALALCCYITNDPKCSDLKQQYIITSYNCCVAALS